MTVDELDLLVADLNTLKARWKSHTKLGKKGRTLLRKCLWAGANLHHLSQTGIPQEVIMETYKAMPDRFHEERAKAVVAKQKKAKEESREDGL